MSQLSIFSYLPDTVLMGQELSTYLSNFEDIQIWTPKCVMNHLDKTHTWQIYPFKERLRCTVTDLAILSDMFTIEAAMDHMCIMSTLPMDKLQEYSGLYSSLWAVMERRYNGLMIDSLVHCSE